MHHDLIEENSNELYACDLTARPYPTWKRLNLTCLGIPPLSCDKLSNFVYNDKIYLFGGYGPRPASDIRFALPRSTTWIVDPTQRRGWNNQLVIYDPLKNEYTWPKTKGKEPSPRAAHAMAIDSDKKIAYVLISISINTKYVLFIIVYILSLYFYSIATPSPRTIPAQFISKTL